MKYFIIIFTIFFVTSCAPQKFEKPPKPNKMRLKDIKPSDLEKGHLILNLGELKQNENNLYCWENESKCNIINGKITLYNHSIAKGDNASVTERLYAEGEFLEGKYQGIWKYFDEDRKIIKKEKWDNGKLVHSKGYK